jgi:hypothetical protein
MFGKVDNDKKITIRPLGYKFVQIEKFPFIQGVSKLANSEFRVW